MIDRFLAALSRLFAQAGMVVAALMALLVVVSIAGRATMSRPIQGDVELTQFGVALCIIARNVGSYGISEVDNGMPPPAKLIADERFAGAGGARDTTHHNLLISPMNNSFSQSSPTLTRI